MGTLEDNTAGKSSLDARLESDAAGESPLVGLVVTTASRLSTREQE